MKNVFKLSSLLVVVLVLFQFSCKEEETPVEPTIPDPSGKWALTSATLVDGNSATETADSLIVQNFTTDGQTFFTLKLPVGEMETTSALVGGALAATTCQNPANYGTFYIELTADNNALVFNCAGESITATAGSWSVLKDSDGNYTILNLSVNLEGVPVPVQINLQNMEISATSLTGRAVGYPMKVDFLKDISEPGNLQTMTTDMVFTKVP